jgi:hypothetical protein
MTTLMKTINQLQTTADLADGEVALPEIDVVYKLRTLDDGELNVGVVVAVLRLGDTLFARTDMGITVEVTGHGAAILVPHNV